MLFDGHSFNFWYRCQGWDSWKHNRAKSGKQTNFDVPGITLYIRWAIRLTIIAFLVGILWILDQDFLSFFEVRHSFYLQNNQSSLLNPSMKSFTINDFCLKMSWCRYHSALCSPQTMFESFEKSKKSIIRIFELYEKLNYRIFEHSKENIRVPVYTTNSFDGIRRILRIHFHFFSWAIFLLKISAQHMRQGKLDKLWVLITIIPW